MTARLQCGAGARINAREPKNRERSVGSHDLFDGGGITAAVAATT